MLDRLHGFLLIAEHGTFAAAARHAHLSQPALSASIQKLEAVIGAPLFERGRHGARLTPAGEALVPHARAALAAVQAGVRAAGEVTGLVRGEVRLGGGATAVTYLLPPRLRPFATAHPGLRYSLREGFTAELVAAVEAGTLDLAVITIDAAHPPPRPEVLDRWRPDDLIVVAAPGLEPSRAGWITFAEGSPTRALLLRHHPAADIVMQLGSIAAVKGNARAGLGMALVSRDAVITDLASGVLREVPMPFAPITRWLGLRHRGPAGLPPAAAALRAHLLADAIAPTPPAHARRRRRVGRTRTPRRPVR